MKMTTDVQQGSGAGLGTTATLVGVRMFQALGWRVGAGALLLAGCPLATVGGWFLSYTDRCVEVVKAGRDGVYELCTNYSGEWIIGYAAVGLALVLLLGAAGLWKRGGAVRDVELLAEAVEGA